MSRGVAECVYVSVRESDHSGILAVSGWISIISDMNCMGGMFCCEMGLPVHTIKILQGNSQKINLL